jgi:hypothetical protein
MKNVRDLIFLQLSAAKLFIHAPGKLKASNKLDFLSLGVHISAENCKYILILTFCLAFSRNSAFLDNNAAV